MKYIITLLRTATLMFVLFPFAVVGVIQTTVVRDGDLLWFSSCVLAVAIAVTLQLTSLETN